MDDKLKNSGDTSESFDSSWSFGDDTQTSETSEGTFKEDPDYIYPRKNNTDYSDNYHIDYEPKIRDAESNLTFDENSENTVTMSKSLRAFLVTSVIVLLLLLSLIVGYLIYYKNTGDNKILDVPGLSSQDKQSSNTQNPENPTGTASINIESKPADTNEMPAGNVYEKVAPAVVGVVVYDSAADIFSDPISQGSGVIISEDGYIVTNSHVVGDSKQYGIKIVLNTMEEVSGKVVGFDKKTDLAVIKAEKSGLTKASFADSDQVKVGDWALAIGNPGLGDLTFYSSLTRGIVSAVNRSLGGSQKLVKFIQTDAPINSGNSGGCLCNMYGQVIGISTVKLNNPYYEGMGFAIPSNTVKSVVDSIIAKGYVSGRVILGISGKMVTAYQAQIYNVPMGVVIAKISAESDLGNKGVKVGDIVIKVDGTNVTGMDVLSEELSKHKVGETVKLTIYRPSSDRSNYSTFDVNIHLIEDKGEAEPTNNNTSSRFR